jgi:hypothetical protein
MLACADVTTPLAAIFGVPLVPLLEVAQNLAAELVNNAEGASHATDIFRGLSVR